MGRAKSCHRVWGVCCVWVCVGVLENRSLLWDKERPPTPTPLTPLRKHEPQVWKGAKPTTYENLPRLLPQ